MSIQSEGHGALFYTRNGCRRLYVPGLFTALTLALGTAPASAQYYGYDYGIFHRPEHRAAKHVSKEREVSKDPFGDMPKGPLQIFISIDQQKLHLYSDGIHVADTSVATGVPSLPTPQGVFSVIQKQVFHRSNIYSNAPMPFMQRITWSGVALHEGEDIGHPASHGCIRMPHDFAVRLYHVTKLGVPVVIARQELKPVEFADAHLFVHRDQAPAPALAPIAAAPSVAPVPASPATLGLRVSTDGNVAAATSPAAPTAPVAVSDTAKTGPTANDPPSSAVPAANAASGVIAAAPAVTAVDASVPMPPAEPADLVKSAPASKSPIAIFISRQEKKIYVRQDFTPLFQAPVAIADPDKPLGTLVFTALEFTGDDHTTLRWDVVAIPGEPPPQPKRKAERETRYEKYIHGRHESEQRGKPADLLPPQSPAEALARIDIPQAAVDYISQLIVPGSSLIVSDHGLGEETGDGTGFIVVTR